MPSGAELARRTGWVQPKVSPGDRGTAAQRGRSANLGSADRRVERGGRGAPGHAVHGPRRVHIHCGPARPRCTGRPASAHRGDRGRRHPGSASISRRCSLAWYRPRPIPGPHLSCLVAPDPRGPRKQSWTGSSPPGPRVQALLSEPGRRWQFVIGETALRSCPGSRELQLEQLDHLVVVSQLPAVELGVVPMRAPMPVLPLCGFRLLDDEFVFRGVVGRGAAAGRSRGDRPDHPGIRGTLRR